MDEIATSGAPAAASDDLTALVVTLLKGVLYREGDERLWGALIDLQARVRDYVAVLGLELVLDDAEGYSFLRSRLDAGDDESAPKLPRLIARRPLSFPVSLLLALLRKKLAEFDASGTGTRLVLARDDIVELVRVFLPVSSNEARLIDQIETHINRVADLGFLRRLKTTSGPPSFEVRRILKAFVDAQWLAEFDARLAQYQRHLAGGEADSERTDDE
ncbi:MAG: DUF4194 domain-containing protein [Burkholderiales bacterium]|nr:DUF4194 domain-containing protein [Burkholderiales bacterium]